MKRALTALATLATILTLTTVAAAANPRATLPGSVPPWATHSNYAGSANPNSPVNFRVYLGLRDQAAAEALALAVSDPHSASYGKFLTPDEFNARFAPSGADVSAVSSWLASQGLTVDFVPSNDHYVQAEGSVAQVQAAFGVTLGMYSVAGKSLRANGSPLAVPSSLVDKIAGVIGIDQTSALVHSNIARDPEGLPPAGFRNAPPCSTYWDEKNTANTQVPQTNGTPANLPDYPNTAGSSHPFAPCGYRGLQLQSAYGVAGAIAGGTDGRGVTVAVIDAYASPTIVQDTTTYFADHGLPAWNAGQFRQVVAPGTFHHPESPKQDPEGWSGEETLDVEAVHTMAPGANVVYVGAPNNYQDLDAAMNHVVASRLADIVTNSYGFSSELLPPGYILPFEATLIQGALEGMGIYFSSGDGGDETGGGPANTATPDWPAVSPWVTAVGGTSVGIDQDNSIKVQTGWGTKRARLQKTPTSTCNGLFYAGAQWCATETYLYGSGGGTSRLFAQPSYQAGVVPNALAQRWTGSGGAKARVIPDIAAVGDPNTGMLIGQTQRFQTGTAYDEYRIGGTSLSSPLMAGVMAVAQQARGSRIGFANPLLYSLPGSAFNDVDHIAGLAVVRADYVNGQSATNAGTGIIYSIRTMDVTFSIHTTAGYDDVTGRGTPNGTFLTSIAGH